MGYGQVPEELEPESAESASEESGIWVTGNFK
jgi:hypothetical protein